MTNSYDQIIQSERNRLRGNNYSSNNNNWNWSSFLGKALIAGAIAYGAYTCSGTNYNINFGSNSKPKKEITKPYDKGKGKITNPGKSENNSNKNTKDTGLEGKLDDTKTSKESSQDKDCYKTIRQMLTEPCFTDPSVIYQENGIEYSYTGVEEVEVPRKYNKKGKPKGTKTINMHNFTSLDGTRELPIREDRLSTIDQIYREKLVDCNEPVVQVIEEPAYENKRSVRQNIRNQAVRNVSGGYNNTNVQIMASGRNGGFMFSSGNPYGAGMYGMNMMGFGGMMMPSMMFPGFNGRVMGYQPTGYIVPQGFRYTRPEVNGQVLDEFERPFRGSDGSMINNIRNTTKPSPMQRAWNNQMRNRPY